MVSSDLLHADGVSSSQAARQANLNCPTVLLGISFFAKENIASVPKLF
jgi:hypothetical protein